MIGSRSEEHQRDLNVLAEDLGSLLRGEDSEFTEAACRWLTETIDVWRRSMTGEKR
jgi:hypothetical protein